MSNFTDHLTPRLYLRFEGAMLLAAAAMAFRSLPQGPSWGDFWLLFFLPDFALIGYLRNPSVGAAAYNLMHSEVIPFTVLAFAWLNEHQMATGVAFVWLAHIGFDRAVGYGLKQPRSFAETHLGRVGRASPLATDSM